MNKILLFLLIVLLGGCQDNIKTKTVYKDLKSNLVIDSICIPLDSISLASYPSATYIYSTDSSTAMYAFNSKTWMVDIFDLNKKCLSGHIALEREGADGVPYIRSMQVLSIDSIVCFNDNGFLIFNEKGKVISKEALTYVASDCVGNFEISQFLQPFYDKKHKKIYGRLITSKDPYPYPPMEKLFAEYDLCDRRWTALPLELPPYMQKYWQRMGQNRNLNIWISHTRICYNFTCLSDIFIYNMIDQRLQIVGGESRLVDNEVSFYDGDPQNEKAKWQHWIDNPVFYAPIYDKFKDIYYRIQVSELNKHCNDLPTPYDKKIVLALFNNNLEMISEFQLENYKYNFLFFGVDKEGLIVGGNNPRDKSIDYEVLKLYRLKIIM